MTSSNGAVAEEPAAALGTLRSLLTDEGWPTASSRQGRFAALFGRDALVTSLQVLPRNPSVAQAALERLARELGIRHDRETEEEPGRVIHEARDEGLEHHIAHGWPVRQGRLRYYGSADANAWFLILIAALARFGHDIRPLRRAGAEVAEWLARRPQPIAYVRRSSSGGLAHQGWRDVAWESPRLGHGVVSEDGRPLRPPVAMAEVQAVCWRGLQEAATMLDQRWQPAAERALSAFLGTFLRYREGAGSGVPAFAHHADGLDRAATSDLGRILWTGVLDAVAGSPRATWRRLLRPDLTTPWGVRTLSSGHRCFRPDGYHMGAIWPVDSWLGAGGLDSVEPSSGAQVCDGVRQAISRIGGYPELYAVDLEANLRPIEEACAIQAWTVGAVIAISDGWDGRAWAR